MGGLFSSSKKKEDPAKEFSEKDKAILELKRQRVRLVQYRTQAESVLARETAVAKQLLKKGDKKRALLTLKKKKYQQTLLDKTETQLFNIEELTNSIEFAAVQLKVFEALKTGNTVLQKINDSMKIEDVEKLMEESAEAIEHQNKVNELLGNELTAADTDAIEAELAALEEGEKKAVDSKVDVKSSLAVPAGDAKEKRRPSLTPIAVPGVLLEGRLDLQSPSFEPAGVGMQPSTPLVKQAAIAEQNNTATALPAVQPASASAPKRVLVLS